MEVETGSGSRVRSQQRMRLEKSLTENDGTPVRWLPQIPALCSHQRPWSESGLSIHAAAMLFGHPTDVDRAADCKCGAHF